MSSPLIFQAPMFEGKRQINGDSYQNKHGKKRKPVDPPEEGTIDHINYYDTTNNTHKRQRASPDDLFGTLSLKPPDPPAHSFCKRKKEGNDDDSIGNLLDGDDVRYAKLPRLQNEDDAELKKGSIQLKRIDDDEETSLLMSSSTGNAKPDPDETQQNTSEIDNGMSIDDNASINSNSDGSISEGSLQRAMYQAVFGRRNTAQHQFHSLPATISLSGGNGIGCYDAVDSKIEDLIRRSRIEAEIRRRKEELKQVTTTDTEGVEKSQSQDVADEDEKMEMDE